jgi:hypothetical protein
MALTTTQAAVSNLLTAMFNAAPGKEFLDLFTAQVEAGQTIDELAEQLAASGAFTGLYPSSQSDVQFSTAWVTTLLGGQVTDAANVQFGIDYVTGLLGGGASRADVIQSVSALLVAADNADAVWGNASAQFENKLQAAQNFSETQTSTDFAVLQAAISSVTEDPTTVPDVVPVVVPPVAGDTFTLTSGTDRGADFTGTANDDQFNAYLAQNSFSGGVSNSLSSADVLDGAEGTDSLYAELVPEFFGATGNNQIDVQARTSNIEIVQIEARDAGSNDTTNTTVTVDAKNMLDVDKIGSYMSDGDLVIENLTTQQSNGEDRNTEELTITMDHTDNFNSDNDASDLTVYFDEDYLLVGNTTSASQANYWLLDENSVDYVNEPLLTIERTGVTLTIDGVAVTIQMTDAVAAAADDWVSFAAGLQDVIDAQVAAGEAVFEGLTVAVDVNNTDSTFNDAGVEVTIPAITITDAAGRALNPTGFTSPQEVTPGFDIYGKFDNVPATTAANPLSINVELHKAGREGEGGDLVIGGKELDQDGGAQNQGNGIGVFNIDVLGDEAKLSNVGGINSTNNALTTVNIATGAAFVGGTTFASLTVRDAFDESTAVETVNANAFLGDLNIGQDDAALNVDTFTATGGGVVTYNAEIDGTEKGVFTNTTGAAADTITVTLDGDAVDTVNTGFAVNAGNGNNNVTVSMTTGDVSVATTALLDNLSITTGTGEDTILLNGGSTGATDGDSDFNIASGAGSDFVEIRSRDDASSSANDAVVNVAAEQTITVGGAGAAGETLIIDGISITTQATTDATANAIAAALNADETFAAKATATSDGASVVTVVFASAGVATLLTEVATAANTLVVATSVPGVSAAPAAATGSWVVGTATGANTFVDTVLYNATLTVNFAGFEQEVTVVTTTANNFIATQIDINNAIKAAIAANPELARLLTTTDGTSSQQLTIESTVEGDNDFTVTLVQPSVAAGDVTGDRVSLQTGLIETTGTTSTLTTTDAQVAALILDGNINETGTVAGADLIVDTGDGTDGTDETNVTNVSTIDMGTGTNDLVVLNSDDDSANTLDFSANWGKVSVVNFFDDQAGDPLTPTQGDHLLDFTAFLNDEISTSGSALSATSIDTNIAVVTAMTANSVSETTFATLSALDGNATNTWDSITDGEVLTALQADGTYGTAGATANLVGTTRDSLLFVENADNLGEYKVYNVELTNVAGTDNTGFTGVDLVGVVDFGASINTGLIANFVL